MNCHGCKKEFTPDTRHAYARYCSTKCRLRFWKRGSIPGVFTRDFLAWDGEGEGKKYTLLANSQGFTLCNRNRGLRTKEILRALVTRGHGYNNIWYGFGYDVTMILASALPFNLHAKLYKDKKIVWDDYLIMYIPRKQFLVKHLPSGKSFNSYDTIGFFQCSFEDAIKEWFPNEKFKVITKGKKGRADFSKWKMDDIIAYNAEECRVLVALMNKFRDALIEAGLEVRRFDGAGAIASVWLQKHGAKKYYGELPDDMEIPIRSAYFGGRNDVACIGHTPCYGYDINSAYPAAMRQVPDLTRIKWRNTKSKVCDETDFALVRIRWNLPERELIFWGPFPWRSKGASILYPLEGEGWYYACEVREVLRRFNKKYFTILEQWIPRGEIVHPLEAATDNDYATRARWKRENNPANIPLKLGLNSCYGKFMQRKGFNDQPPAFRNYLWGGYITAQTRTWMGFAIRTVGDSNVLAAATDGIFTLKPLPKNATSESELGKWKHEKEIAAIDLCGSGLYQTYRDNQKVFKNKRRGFGNVAIDYQAIFRKWAQGKIATAKTRRFIGIGLAAATNKYRHSLACFVDLSKTINDPRRVGTEKRLPSGHVKGNLTWLEPSEIPYGASPISYPYFPSDEVDERTLEMETVE